MADRRPGGVTAGQHPRQRPDRLGQAQYPLGQARVPGSGDHFQTHRSAVPTAASALTVSVTGSTGCGCTRAAPDQPPTRSTGAAAAETRPHQARYTQSAHQEPVPGDG